VMDWFTRASESIQKFNEGNKPKNKVRSTKSREEVVQKAAIRSALAPKDDFVSISKKISNAPKQASQNATLTIGKPSELPTPTWGSYEKSAPDVEGVKPVVEVTGFQSEDPTKVTSEIASAITEPAPSEPVWPTVSMETVDTAPEIIDEVVTETSAGEAASLTPESIPEETGEIIEAQETVIDEIEIPEIVDDTLVTTEGFPTQSPAPAYQSSGSTAAPEMSFSLWRIGAVSILAILLGITTTFWIFGGKKDTVVIQQDEVSSLVKSEEHIPILLGGDTQDFWETVSKVQPRATTVFANIYPTLNISGEIKPATVEQILNILSLQAPGTFTRAITDMSIGLYQNKEPFIVLKVTSFDAAFSGMLSWEKTMSGDLAPFFGTPVLGTFDSRARTETQISEPFFVDTIISNNDTRILVDEARSERIIYSFLNKNTILITSSREALKAVSAAVK